MGSKRGRSKNLEETGTCYVYVCVLPRLETGIVGGGKFRRHSFNKKFPVNRYIENIFQRNGLGLDIP